MLLMVIRDLWFTVGGTILTMQLKMWVVDRMVWIALEGRASGHEWDELDRGSPDTSRQNA